VRALSLDQFITVSRLEMTFDGKEARRRVLRSEITRMTDVGVFEGYMAERIPTYYRSPENIATDLGTGYFMRAIANTLARLPTQDDFRDSHFGELLAAEFAVAAMGLKLLYSKLRLLTAENANAFKMDVVMYDSQAAPVELVLLEVKSSFKAAMNGDEAPKHDTSIYADLFRSFNKYAKDDLRYDLTAARDRLADVDPADRAALEAELDKYGGPMVRYAGVCSIDLATFREEEAAVLATRKNEKRFDVDLLCVVEFAQVIDATFERLSALRDAADGS
jgi:Cap4 SAVED domain